MPSPEIVRRFGTQKASQELGARTSTAGDLGPRQFRHPGAQISFKPWASGSIHWASGDRYDHDLWIKDTHIYIALSRYRMFLLPPVSILIMKLIQ